MNDYEMNERKLHARKMAGEKRTRDEARETVAGIVQAMSDTERMNERAGWMLDGAYGCGAMLAAREIADRPRMNRPAAIVAMVAAYDHNANPGDSAKAWHQLNKSQQNALTAAVMDAINDFLNNQEQ